MDLTYLSLEKKNRVAIAQLNKPKANTYDADLMKDLGKVIDEVRFSEDVDVCVFTSALDGVWSAGADINLLATSTPEYKAMFCLNCPPHRG
ncbi:MAG: enoyl-CoA hydratase-related protein, partial [Candidatus Thermoplasmatota archaeon]|nr:enoyl-CoA hydratase-related protein [Candidatus Thermoplasmatota archaeon]